MSVLWLAADALARNHWPSASWVPHFTFGLWCTVAVTFPVCMGLAVVLGWVLGDRSPRARVCWQLASGAAVGLLVLPTARWTFAGAWVSETPLGRFGPFVLSLATATMTFAVCRSAQYSAEQQRLGHWRSARWLALALAFGGTLGIWVDLNWYVSLYAKLHATLELFSFACLVLAVSLLAREWELRHPVLRVGYWFTALAGLTLAATTALQTTQQAFDTALNHVYREQVYVGRQLRRLRALNAFLEAPSEWKGEQAAALDALTERFDLHDTELDPRWNATLSTAPSWRGSCSQCNLIVFYVDTLRQDTALDSQLMPHLTRFSEEALHFERAYSTGSDTLNALPQLTSGQYPPVKMHAGDLLQVAKRLGMTRALAIPQSAREFLDKLHPDFEFDETLVVPDYAPDKLEVWGYGGDQPSSRQLVDQMLTWLAAHPKQRFLSWIFNFEVHSWRELDEGYLLEGASSAQIPTDGDKSWRYRAAAHHVDREFGRLLQGLKDLDLERDTIVLLVSDHGEALGQWDFWLHSVVVWESLVRVPMIMRIPGFVARKVSRPVSLVDVAPTLASLLGAFDSSHAYHGHPLPLMSNSDEQRRTPILFVGQRKETLVRIAVLDPSARYKLVLPLEVGVPELYDTHALDPDDQNLALDKPLKVAELLDVIVRSPLYPRQPAASVPGSEPAQ